MNRRKQVDMGVSTDAIMFYGMLVKENEQPWGYDEFVWWRGVLGSSEEDNYAYAWDRNNPMPFEVIKHCSKSCPMYGVAVPGTVLTANRGYPEKVRIKDETVLVYGGEMSTFATIPKVDPSEARKVWDACCKYNVPVDWEMAWWMVSFWEE